MASNKAEFRIGADDSDFQSAMTRIRSNAKGSQEQISKLGSAVSGVGFALGTTASQAGGAVSEFANLAGVIGGTGGVGAIIVALTTALAALAGAYVKAREEAAALHKEQLTQGKTALDKAKAAAEEERKRLDAATKGERQVRKEELEAQQKDAQTRLNRLKVELEETRYLWADAMAKMRRNAAGQALSETAAAKLREEILSKDQLGTIGATFQDYAAEVSTLRIRIRQTESELNQWGEALASNKVNNAITGLNQSTQTFNATLKETGKAADDAEKRVENFWAKLAEDSRQFWLEFNAPMAPTAPDAPIAKAVEDYTQALKTQRQTEAAARAQDIQEETDLRIEKAREVYEARRAFEEDLKNQAIALAQNSAIQAAQFAAREFLATNDLRVRLDAARARGDMDAVYSLGNELRELEETRVARMIERVSAEAVGVGSTLVAKGIGEGLLGNPGGWAAAGVGAALIAGGLGGQIFSGMQFSQSRAVSENTAFEYQKNKQAGSAPRTTLGPGRQTAQRDTTVINYYFGGPVFGNQDDAARAVARFNSRGRALEGLP